jgi:hypothetical protein
MASSSWAPLPRSPADIAQPNRSPASALSPTPVEFWCQNWSPVVVGPAALPYKTFTAPASTADPTSSPGTPMATSSSGPPPKSPTDRDAPKESPTSALSSTPAVSWCQSWSPAAVRPAADPKITWITPESTAARFSPGTPTTRSSNPSPFRSPAATAVPNRSLASTVSEIWGEFWVQTWFPVSDRPEAEPYSTCTVPASASDWTSSAGTPTARSSKPSPL